MYGDEITRLALHGRIGEDWEEFFVIEGQQQSSGNEDWLHANISCSGYEEIAIVFNGPSPNPQNYKADIAIDNIVIHSEGI